MSGWWKAWVIASAGLLACGDADGTSSSSGPGGASSGGSGATGGDGSGAAGGAGGAGFSNDFAVDIASGTAWVDGGSASATFSGATLSSLTISFWSRCNDEMPGSGEGLVNIGPPQGGGAQMYWSLETADATMALSVFNAGAVPFTARAAVDSYATWRHYAGVFDATASTVSVYVDGVLGAEVTGDATPLPVEGIVQMGRFYDGPELRFDGQLDEVALWDRALSGEEIAAIAMAGSDADVSQLSAAGLRAYWRMGDDDGGSGTTITNRASGPAANLMDGAVIVSIP